MFRPLSTLLFSAVAICGFVLAGCGSSGDEAEKTTVITPPAEKTEAEETAEPAAAEPEAAETAPEVAATEPEPAVTEEPVAEEPMPEAGETTPSAEPEDEPQPEVAAADSADAESESADEGESETVTAGYTPASVLLGAEPGGTVFKGRVTVKGTVTEPKPIVADKDAFCIDLGDIPDDSLVVSDDGGLANVFVWLQKLPSGAEVPDVPTDSLTLDNVKCRFEPHAFVLRVGQSMLVKNDDPTGHNTHTSPLRNNAFNQLIPPNDRNGVEVVYQQVERLPITTKCDIHPWMSNYHFPVDHPWAAVTDADGNFEITGLPDGDLDFRLWHERMGYVERSVKVTIPNGETHEQNFEVDAAELAK